MVVVGAGPAGLASAITLGSYGVETLVIDKRPSASTMPRATVASTATVELLRRWGLEDAARDASIDVEWRAWACETLATVADGEAIDVGLPSREQAAVISPVEPLCIGQDELEPLMEAHLGHWAASGSSAGSSSPASSRTRTAAICSPWPGPAAGAARSPPAT